jgi:hypothetical protein
VTRKSTPELRRKRRMKVRKREMMRMRTRRKETICKICLKRF